MNKAVKKITFIVIGLAVIACSVKKDTLVGRNYHAVTAEYNILYNGNVAFQTGLDELETTYQDNFWDVLPVERMTEKEENILPGQTKNANFERAEEKAVKAIQKHSMSVGGRERNPQMDEAYLLLGKARYFDNRFVPALEALNYVMYKYPNSNNIYQAKVWREKVNIRLDNNEMAIKNLKLMLEHNKVEGQDLADANAMLTQAYLNKKHVDSAIATIKIAKEFTKNKDQKGRYSYILGQLYNKMNYKDSAYTAFQDVIDLNRQTSRRYLIHAHAEQANLFDYKKGDTIAFLEKFDKLIKDRENRPYLDVLYYQMGEFYKNYEKDSTAVAYYNKSLKSSSQDRYLFAKDYSNIADINFDNSEYKKAGMYYDSTLLRLDDKTREYRKIKKKRDNLVDVIRYEDIAKHGDSILYVTSLSQDGKIKYYEDYIQKLKKEDERKAKIAAELAEKEANMKENSAKNAISSNGISLSGEDEPMATMKAPPGITNTASSSISTSSSTFYFYNPSMVSFGKTEFAKKWGNRKYEKNWRQLSVEGDNEFGVDEEELTTDTDSVVVENPAYKTDFYISQLPTDEKFLDSIAKGRNDAYYQLGVIYKEKFKEYELAANRLEKLLTFQPEERYILPAKYNLVKIYEIIDPSRVSKYKNDIIQNYPSSRYAEILQNPSSIDTSEDNPEKIYKRLYKDFENNKVREVYAEVNQKVDDYFGDESLPKYELLRALVLGRTNGLSAYKESLNYVALTYPNVEEGKQAQSILNNDIPKLEALNFTEEDNASWKIIFPKKYAQGDNYETLQKKLTKYLEDTKRAALKTSIDVYTLTDDFVVLHGFTSKESARAALSLLKDYKDYKVSDTAYIISTENYKVLQAKKMYDEWLKLQSN